jgi:metal-responsive CopG/Arc/MetJ family transcriptional regulator
MKVVQIVLDERLLRSVDREARKAKLNRSELVRRAIDDYLKKRRVAEAEQRHRAGYEAHPPDEFADWDRISAWPED